MSHLSDEQLSLLIDGESSLGAREAAVRHLRDCVGCTERHEWLVDVVAELRLAPAVRWDPQATTAILAQLGGQRRAREWSTAISVVVALVGAVLLVVELPALRALTSLLAVTIDATVAWLPTSIGFSGSTGLAALAAIAIVAPVLAIRIARTSVSGQAHPR